MIYSKLTEQDRSRLDSLIKTDNLTTQQAGILYERFEPEEAERLANKFEGQYAPEHVIGDVSSSVGERKLSVWQRLINPRVCPLRNSIKPPAPLSVVCDRFLCCCQHNWNRSTTGKGVL